MSLCNVHSERSSRFYRARNENWQRSRFYRARNENWSNASVSALDRLKKSRRTALQNAAEEQARCSNASVSALDRLKKSRRTALQNAAEEQAQQQSSDEERQWLWQQHIPATRGSGERPLSSEAVTVAEAQSRAALLIAAGQRKLCVANKTLLSQDRLLPQMSVRPHSSYKSGHVQLTAGKSYCLVVAAGTVHLDM
jgi:DNA-binding LytR/AlgR family response regulator